MPKDAEGCEEVVFLLELIVMRQRTGWKSCTQSQPQRPAGLGLYQEGRVFIMGCVLTREDLSKQKQRERPAYEKDLYRKNEWRKSGEGK